MRPHPIEHRHPRKSTTDRVRKGFRRALLTVVGTASPMLTARWAARRWTTLPRRGASRHLPPVGGTGFVARFEGHRVRGRWWGDGPVVYLVHGWAGDIGQWAALVPALTAAGFRVVAFDAPSHGGSDPGPSGRGRSNGVEFGKALDAVAAVHGPAHAVVAHSLGALATMLTLRYGWLGASQLVFLAPLSELGRHLDRYADDLGLTHRARDQLFATIEKTVGLPIDSFDLVALTSADDCPPLLIVHDERDDRVAVGDSAGVVTAWPATASLTTTHGLGHNGVLIAGQVHEQILAFLRDGEEPDHPPTGGAPDETPLLASEKEASDGPH